MKFEHFALNIADPPAWAAWYVKHLGMRVVRSMPAAPFTHFVADSSGRVVAEVYCNPVEAVPDHRSWHPLRFHFAFAVDAADTVRDDLVAGGATVLTDDVLTDGSHLVMLRDPWGLALQLCQRAQPLG